MGQTNLPVDDLTIPKASEELAAEDDESETDERGFLQAFSALRHRDYRLLWFSTLFSSSGMWIQQVSISWLTYDLTGSAFLLGAVNGFRSVPLLLLGPFGGVAADRLDRKNLMLWTQLFLVLVSAIFATVILTGQTHIWNIILFTLLTGVAWAFNMPVRQSLVPNLVPRHDLQKAIAFNSAGFNITRIIGPSLAGLMIAGIGIAGNFYLQALAYVGVAAMIRMMNVPKSQRADREVSVTKNLAEGLRYVIHHPTLRYQMALALIPVVIAMPFASLMPIFASDILAVGPGGFGLLMAAPGVGALIGTLIIASLGNTKHKGQMLFFGIMGMGLSLVFFSQSRHFTLSLILLILTGAFQIAYMTTNNTVLQMSTSDEFRGRVMGIYMLNQGLMPLGSLIAGIMASAWGAPLTVALMGGVVFLLAILAYFRLPAMRDI